MKTIVKILLFVFFVFVLSSLVMLNKLSYVDTIGSNYLTSVTKTCAAELQMINDYKLEVSRLESQISQLLDVFHKFNLSSKVNVGVTNDLPIALFKRKTSLHRGFHIEDMQTKSYTYFDLWYEYPIGIVPSHHRVGMKLNGLKKMEIDKVIDAAVAAIKDKSGRQMASWRRDHFIEGIYQAIPSLGTSYQLIFLNDKQQMKQVTVFRPEVEPMVIQQQPIQYQKKLYLIVPLSSGKTETLRHFLDNLGDIVSKRRYDVILVLVYFGQSIKELMAIFQPFILKCNFKTYKIKHITSGNFSRGAALDAGIQVIDQRANPLMFLCDVDVIFKESFLRRCMTYTESGKSVYYPIVFSLYNPTVIEYYYNQKFPNWQGQMKHTPDHGFWRDFGFGMACFYRTDYLSVGGFNKNLTGWGDEDIQLYRKFTQTDLTVYRSADPDIFHLWHKKTCDKSLPDDQYQECLRSKVVNEGNQMQLGYLYFKNEIEMLKHNNREHL